MRKVFVLVLCALSFCTSFAAKRKVHTIGDSTMSEYKPAATNKRGWGMYLQAFFNPDSVIVNNRGKSGASTRTFYETENLWPSVKQQMHAGDYLIIQFAHNDEKCKGEDVYVKNTQLRSEGKDTLTDMRGTEPNTTYKEYLRAYVREAREMGVTPVLMSPICRAYFQKDGTINDEGRHDLTNERMKESFEQERDKNVEGVNDKNYVRCMREVAEEMNVPYLDMTAKSLQLFEKEGKDFCMTNYFNCGDKTHTGKYGGMAIAELAYDLIQESSELEELRSWTVHPWTMEYEAYAQRIEDSGKQAAFEAKGTPFSVQCSVFSIQNIEKQKGGYVPTGGLWPAGEIDEVANRYIEYTIEADKKKGLVVESITLPVCAKGGEGMNIHINYGFGDSFSGVTTIYENTALPKNKEIEVNIHQPILVPAGQTLHIRVLPWYDSNGSPQKGKRLILGQLQISGKQLQ